jgi:ABC-2 type transport system ATP-binding protein
MKAIQVNNLSKVYGSTKVLNIPELHIEAGQAFGLVGNNGAGKTTFFRLILDLIQATSGKVSSDEVNVAQNEAWKNYTGSYLDEGFLVDYLTPEEYFQFVGKLNNLSEGDIESFMNSFKDFFNEEILGKKKYIRDLSKGNQKKVGIAAALMSQPEVLILDEPFSNLDPSTQILLKNLLRKVNKEKNMTMLISSHDLNHVTEVCNRIVVLHKGEVVKDIETTPQTLKDLEEYFASQIQAES